MDDVKKRMLRISLYFSLCSLKGRVEITLNRCNEEIESRNMDLIRLNTIRIGEGGGVNEDLVNDIYQMILLRRKLEKIQLEVNNYILESGDDDVIFKGFRGDCVQEETIEDYKGFIQKMNESFERVTEELCKYY